MKHAIGVVVAAGSLAGCSCAPTVVSPADDARRAELLGRLESLQGTWMGSSPDGSTGTAAVFAVSSAGSVVREIMFPGAEHEMTNVYHMDGRSLLLTHYCAIGNQPRLRAVSSTPDSILFELDSVTNFTSGDQAYMGRLLLTFVDSSHIRQEWTSYQNGAVAHETTFDLTRQE